MGSKKHKKHSKGRDEDSPGTPMSGNQQATPIKLVLKMATGSGVAAVNPLPASTSGSIGSSTFGGPSAGTPYVANPGISVRLVSGATDKASPSGPVSVRRLENPGVPNTAASDSLSESSYHTKQHKRNSEKKKKKKKKKHHHHCHHHHKDHHHKHSHHSSTSSTCKDGEKRKDRPEDDEDYDDDERDDRPPKKRRQIPVTESVDNQAPLPTVPLRVPVGVIPAEKPPQMADASLQRLLGVLLNIIQDRDKLEFFAWPVSDVIAPGYSSIIQRPMDLSTMRRKLENRQYSSLPEFKTDVKLICDNACQYNAAETIYYREAKKLWRNVQKLFTKEGVLQLDPNFQYIGNLTIDVLGFDLRETSPIEEPAPARVTRNRIRVTDDEEKVGIVPPMKISLAASAVEAPVVEPSVARQRIPHREPEPEISLRAAAAVHKSPVINDSHSEVAPATEQSPVIITGRLEPNKNIENEKPRAPSPSVAKKSDPNDPEDFTDLTPPPDDSPPEVILAHAQRMARFASQKLRRTRPNTQIHIVCSPEPGSASLKFINPDVTLTEKYLGWRPKYPQVPAEEIDLEMLIGKLPYGMSSLAEFKDDTRNVVKPIDYLPLESGPPFSTYAPHYDSTFSNLTKAESDLIYAVYGDEIGVQYAESLMHFAKDSEETKERVDDLLDSLTDGEHRKTVDKIKSRELLRDDEDDDTSRPSNDQNDEVLPVRLNGDHSVQPVSSPSISTSGMTVHNESSQSPLPATAPLSVSATPETTTTTASTAEPEAPSTSKVANAPCATNGDSSHPVSATPEDGNEQKLQSKLTESTEMIETLTKLQKERLSKAPPNNLGNVPGPTATELRLAEKLAATLSELASHAKPGSIVSVEAIRRAMGITLPEKKVQPVEEALTEAK